MQVFSAITNAWYLLDLNRKLIYCIAFFANMNRMRLPPPFTVLPVAWYKSLFMAIYSRLAFYLRNLLKLLFHIATGMCEIERICLRQDINASWKASYVCTA